MVHAPLALRHAPLQVPAGCPCTSEARHLLSTCLKVPMTICAVTLLLLATASSASNTAMGTAGRNALGHGSGAPTDGAGESGGGQKYTEHPATFCAAILCHVNSEVNSKTCT